MPIALLFLQQHWKKIVAGAGIAGLCLYIWFINHSRDSLRTELEYTKSLLEVQEAANTGMKTAIEEQNKSIEEWKRKSEELSAKVTAAKREAQKAQAAVQERVVEVYRDKIDPGCEGAMNYLREKAKELGIWELERPALQ